VIVSASLACAWLLGVALEAAVPMQSHKAPAESLAQEPAVVGDERRETLAEMWQRGILAVDMNQWSPADMGLLRRMRRAEAAGAFGLLRQRFHTLKGFAVQEPLSGKRPARVRLTRAGFDKYLLVKSQDALRYFESKGVDVKWAYGLTDMQGRALFDKGRGLLTEAGEELYGRASQNLPTFWKTRAGEVMGNRRPP